VPTSVLVRVRQDTRLDHGAQADVRANAGVLRSGLFEAATFAQATWASGKSNAQLYGVGMQEAAATGLPAFQAGSGWSVASAGVFASVKLAGRWIFVGTAERHWLGGRDAQSPLAERTAGNTASVGLAYRN
jgi:outer membrane scaffolding protein for murein synthesis (MipA/OmpV family)